MAEVAKWMDMASTNTARAGTAGGKIGVRGIMSQLRTLKEHEELLERMPEVKSHFEKLLDLVGTMREEILAPQRDAVETAVKALDATKGGLPDGSLWSDGLPTAEADITEEKLLELAEQTLLKMDGAKFSDDISVLERAWQSYMEWSEVMDQAVDPALQDCSDTRLQECKATKYTALMVHHRKKDTNSIALRRNIRRFREALQVCGWTVKK